LRDAFHFTAAKSSKQPFNASYIGHFQTYPNFTRANATLAGLNLSDLSNGSTWKTSKPFYLVWSKSRALTPKAEILRDWIVSKSKVRGG
jgi:hypothetical protein